MNAILWQLNQGRKTGEPVILFDAPTGVTSSVCANECYKFCSKSGSSSNTVYFSYFEIDRMVFQVFLWKFTVGEVEHAKDIVITESGKTARIFYDTFFDAEERDVTLKSAVVGLEELNKVYWRNVSGEASFTIEEIKDPKKNALKAIIELFS